MGTHDDNDRDPMIARALGQVPVLPRPPDFLDRLDDALDAVDEERRSPPAAAPAAIPSQPAPTTQPGATVPVDLTDPRSDNDVADLSARRHQKSGRRYRVLAAAASVAVILGGVAVLTRDDGTGRSTIDPAGEGSGATATQPAEGESSRHAALQSAIEAVQAWSSALADGDGDAAWRLMGPLSQSYLTAQGGWDDMVTTMGEGSFTKWHRYELPPLTAAPARASGDESTRALTGAAADGFTVRVAFLPDTEDVAVVTLSDVLELEGTRDRVLDSFPLTRDGDGPWQVEPFAFGPGETLADFIVPGLAEGGGLEDVERGFTLEVSAPGATGVFIDAEGGAFRSLERAGGERWTDSIVSGLPGGTVDYVVVTRGPDFITAHPVRFFVKGTQPSACPDIGFTPNSDDVAGDITIVSGDCAEAERLVRHVHEELKHSFFDGPSYFTAIGYECTVRTESEGLESGLYRCTNGDKLVRWRKT